MTSIEHVGSESTYDQIKSKEMLEQFLYSLDPSLMEECFLYFCSERREVDLLDCFLQHVDISAIHFDNFTALAAAPTEIVVYLLDHGLPIDLKDGSSQTLLFEASFQGKVELVDLLIERGANVNQRDSSGETPLFLAVLSKEPRVTDQLIRAGADLDIVNNKGKNVLALAFEWSDVEVLVMLIQAKRPANYLELTTMIGVSYFDHNGTESTRTKRIWSQAMKGYSTYFLKN